jgi:hypothetical protein
MHSNQDGNHVRRTTLQGSRRGLTTRSS